MPKDLDWASEIRRAPEMPRVHVNTKGQEIPMVHVNTKVLEWCLSRRGAMRTRGMLR